MPKKKDSLTTYRAKRDFSTTPEPSGKTITAKLKKSKKPLFVIQKHQASRLHYDFRLQIGTVMPSWAVPKGPSVDPSVKRLAVQTEDHPLDYAYFEGIIPRGYGAGEVMVWDIGTYKTLKDESMEESLKKGRIEIYLKGKKLQGGYALIRTSPQKNWLLFKLKDEFANARNKNLLTEQNRSVLTNRTLREIKNDKASKIYG